MGFLEIKKILPGREPDSSFLPSQGTINEIIEKGDTIVLKLSVYSRVGKIEEFEMPKTILSYYPCKVGDRVMISSSFCSEQLPAIAVLSQNAKNDG
jgi:hypothetical protein